MSIAELNIVDAIGVDKKENALRMMISDHLDGKIKISIWKYYKKKSMHIFSILAISNMKVNMEMILKYMRHLRTLVSVEKVSSNLINIT